MSTFVDEARRYCEFVETAADRLLRDRLRTARDRLLALYLAALPLPHVDPSDEDLDEPSVAAPAWWSGFGEKDGYWEVFDPLTNDIPAPGNTTLSDDVIDVYLDVKRGLALWDASKHEDAVFQWRLLFDTHWGDQAIDALRTLHDACK